MKGKLSLATLVFTSVLIAWSAAPTEDGAYREVTIASLGGPEIAPGTRVKVTGKYRELLDKDLVLFDCKVPFYFARQDLIKKLLDFKAQRDNVTISGTTAVKDGAIVVEVDDLSAAASDLEVFTLEAEVLSRDGKGRKELPGLVKRILSTCERYDAGELVPLAQRVFDESLGPAGEKLDSAGFAERLALVREMHRVVKKNDLTLALAMSLERKSPDHPAIRELLGKLNCRKYRGGWVTYAELKRREGLLEHDGRWITQREQHLIEALEGFQSNKQPNLILRKRTDREYQFLAERGTLEEGMKPEEVNLALGFPDRVERRIVQGKEFDQWCYGSRYCYFNGGILVKKPDP